MAGQMKRTDTHATVIRFRDDEWDALSKLARGLNDIDTCPTCGARHKRSGVSGVIRIAVSEYLERHRERKP